MISLIIKESEGTSASFRPGCTPAAGAEMRRAQNSGPSLRSLGQEDLGEEREGIHGELA